MSLGLKDVENQKTRVVDDVEQGRRERLRPASMSSGRNHPVAKLVPDTKPNNPLDINRLRPTGPASGIRGLDHVIGVPPRACRHCATNDRC